MDLARTELIRFLGMRPPFDALAADELAELAEATELEFHPRGAAILTEDGGPVTFLRVISAGAVRIVHAGRLLDLLVSGDSFGHDAMLAGMPPGFEARAAEDTLCYRIPAESAGPLLARARHGMLALRAGDPANRAVTHLIRTATVLCSPEQPIAEVAAEMTQAGTDAALVRLERHPAGPPEAGGWVDGFGIVTDHDLRSRVLAAGVSAEAPVGSIMTTPVFTVTPDRLGAEVMFALLERGLHHVPVLTRSGQVVGIVSDSDLSAPRERAWFRIRRLIDAAGDQSGLAAASKTIMPVLIDLHRAGVAALAIARVLSALTDALIVRALELSGAAPSPECPSLWLALAGHARRELTPASGPIAASVGARIPVPVPAPATSLAALLGACGIPDPVPAQTAPEWVRGALAGDPLARLVLCDRRPLAGPPALLPDGVETDSLREVLLRLLAEECLRLTVPTGFDRSGLLLHPDDRRAEELDIATAAVVPIEALARWGGWAAGETGAGTPERLAATAELGLIDAADARALTEALTLAFELRMGHQLECISAGVPPDDRIDVATLSPFTRSQLREVFLTISAVQRRLR
ncbi:putative nucleotidyltransferase substrate binding domain-containing protein [Conexibacter sp. DBS9H8]|uniref:putative nucleotidyltransferase substrate binding domain-containing protein n=1 Tax=Conexibacter sp. DBS9H8 TaxID=2937801 RepID=UPI00200BFF5E|nr:putative nucleotidyltransferase substrate binding domain-containing protein [Conexibacter sp. DBS9H8]